MDYGQILSWIVGAVGLIGFYFAGKRKWWSWYINLGCQILWALYAFVTGQPAFLVTAAVYFVIFAVNAYKWTKDHLFVKKLLKNEESNGVPEESNLVKHARHELELIGEEPEVIEWYLRVIREYSTFGHSGGSAWATAIVLEELLRFRPLTELTDDLDEWQYHGKEVWDGNKGVWQNRRDGRAFSHDAGKTYYLVDDRDTIIHSIPKEQLVANRGNVQED